MGDQAFTSATVEEAVQQMEVQAVNFAYRFIQDTRVRAEYMKSTKEMAEQIRGLYEKGELGAKQAAEMANIIRNEIMELRGLNLAIWGGRRRDHSNPRD